MSYNWQTVKFTLVLWILTKAYGCLTTTTTKIGNIATTPQNFFQSFPSPLPSLATADLFSITIVLPFPKYHVSGIIQYVTFWKIQLLSLSIVHLGFNHVITHTSSPFLLLGSIAFYGCTTSLLILLLMDIFQFLVIMNKAYIFSCGLMFAFLLGKYLIVGFAGLHVKCMFNFSIPISNVRELFLFHILTSTAWPVFSPF